MYHYKWLVVLLLLNGIKAASITFGNATRIASNTPPILALANVGSPSVCTQGIYYLTSATSTNCLIFKSADGLNTKTTCDPNVVGSTSMACGVRFCHLTNPITHELVIIDSNNGNFYRTYGTGIVYSPAAIAVYEFVAPNTNFFEVFVVDALDNSLWYFKIRKTGNSPSGFVSSQKLFVSTSTGAPAGIHRVNEVLYLVFQGDTHIQTFFFTASAFSNAQITNTGLWPVASFTNIRAFYVDYYTRLFVYDAGCACTKVYSPDQQLVGSIPDGSNPPSFITASRNHIFFVDSLGVMRYVEPISFTYSVTDKLCSSMLGTVDITSSGGAFPLVYYVYPDFDGITKNTWRAEATGSISLDVYQPTYPSILFNETLNNYYTYDLDNAVFQTVDSSVFPAYTGNNSLMVNLSFGGDVYFYCRDYWTCITPQYTKIEFMLNIGNGNQSFQIDLFFANLDANGYRNPPQFAQVLYTTYIRPDTLPLNNWTKITIPMPKVYATGFAIHDLSLKEHQEPFYIDDWIMIPENSPRKVLIKDYCGAFVFGEEFEITNNNAFLASLKTTPSTCNAAQRDNGANATDGTVTAVLQNGVAPFVYEWTFEGADTSSDIVTNVSALTTYITVYDNALNSSWLDTSDAVHSLNDTTYFHSAPYAIKMVMREGENTASVRFASKSDMRSNVGSTISMWLYGGPIGGQDLLFYTFYRGSETYLGVANIHEMIPGCTGGIPPNIWVKATFTFVAEVTFSEFALLQYRDAAQNPLYIDDITISLKPALTVNDSVGCSEVVRDLAVLSPQPLKIATEATNALCYNTSSGSVALDVTGGVTPYSIQYSAGSVKTRTDIVSVIESLPETKIVFDVTDAHGCTATQVIETILQPPALSLTLSNEPIKCYGGSTSIISSISGGMAPYTYAWSSSSPITLTPQPEPAPIFTDSVSLMYTLSSNAKIACLGTGSQSSLSYQPSHSGYCALFPSFSQSSPSINISCPSVAPSKFAGVEIWMYVETSSDAQNLRISLAKGNTAVSTPVPISTIAKITPGSWNRVFYNISNTTVSDANPTHIVITSTTPTTMGRVILDDIVLIPKLASSVGIIVYSGFNSIVSGKAGRYFLTVVDANGCSFTKQVIIDQPAQLQLRAEILNAANNEAKDGSISVTAIGGTAPYTYKWTELNVAGSNVSGLSYGGYSVEVTDANGCVFGDKFVVQFEDRLTLRKYDSKLSGGLGAIVGLGTLVGLFGLTMLIIYWRSFSKLGNFFSFVITIGVLVSYIAALVLLPEPTDQLCVAYPWLLGIAFTFVYGCLFLKTWALYRVWMKAIQYKKSNLTTISILRTVGVILLVEVAILAAWTATDPPKVHLKKVEGHTAQAQCDTDTPTFWIIFMAVKGAWLVFGAILCVLTRNLKKEYNESSNIAYAIYAILILMAIAVPLALLLDSVPGGRLVIEVIVPVLAFTSTLIIMFYHTWKTSFYGEVIRVTPAGASNTTAFSTGRSPQASHNSSKASNEISSGASVSRSSADMSR